MPVLLIICTVHILTRLVHFQFKMQLIKQVSSSKQISAKNVHFQLSVIKYKKSFPFLHWCVWQKERQKNWQRKKKTHHQITFHADIVFHREKLSSALLLSYWLGGRHHTPRHTTKSMFENLLQKPARKFDIKGKLVLFTKSESLTFAICWMIVLNSLTPRFGVKVDALGSGELQGMCTLPAATDLSANTSSPLLVKSKSTERSGGI